MDEPEAVVVVKEAKELKGSKDAKDSRDAKESNDSKDAKETAKNSAKAKAAPPPPAPAPAKGRSKAVSKTSPAAKAGVAAKRTAKPARAVNDSSGKRSTKAGKVHAKGKAAKKRK
jgi:hypothetical protein